MAHAEILVVEDDDSARLALVRILEGAGYRITAAATGARAMQALAANAYDLVLSDMRLPDSSGIAVLEATINHPSNPATVLLTGHGTIETAIDAIRLGASDYLLKPCPPQTLLEVIERALQRRRSALAEHEVIRSLARGVAQIQQQLELITIPGGAATPPAISESRPSSNTINFGELEIGRFPHQVFYRRTPIHVTPIEHALLRCLGEAGGDVVAYDEIVRRTHGLALPSSEAQALLKSHVRNLRRKVDPSLLVNVRHAGYQLSLASQGATDDPSDL